MIIFLYGEDTYRMKEKLKEIVEGYQKVRTSGLNLKYFSGDSFGDFKNEIKQASMFQERKLAIVLNPFDSLEFKESFLKEGENFVDSSDVVVVYQEGKVAKNNTLLNFLIKKAKSQKFKLLTGVKLRNWALKEFSKYGVRIDGQALTAFLNFIGSDLWRMSNEIKKLASYKKYLEAKDIQLMVRSGINTDIFRTIEAISQKNKKEALALLYKHIENGDSPIYLLSMINYQFRNLLIIKDLINRATPYYAIVKKSKLHPFVIKKSYYSAQRFDFQELKNIYNKIFKLDMKIKTGKVEPATALDLLVAEI